MKVAFLGLGVMGYPMAGHLARAGHEMTVFNRTKSRVVKWMEEYPGLLAPTPEAAVKEADVVVACVGNDDHLREITLGKHGAFDAMRKGTLFIDHTTASADIACELSKEAKDRGFAFMDAPISGGQIGAENGELTIMVGGSPTDFMHGSAVLDVYGKSVKLMGPVGSGQLTKMVNQICVAGLLQALAEGLHFAEAAGLNAKSVMSLLSKGAASSWQMENRHETMLNGEYDFGFAVDWMRKDLGMALKEAENIGVELPVTDLVNKFYGDVQSMGGGRWDTSSLLARLQAKDIG